LSATEFFQIGLLHPSNSYNHWSAGWKGSLDASGPASRNKQGCCQH